MKLLEHTEHGRTHAYNDSELQFLLSQGWKIVDDTKAPVTKAPVQEIESSKFESKPASKHKGWPKGKPRGKR